MRTAQNLPLANFGVSKMACIVSLFCVTAAIVSSAQTLTTLVSFDGTNGAGPVYSLTQARDGNLYGATTFGGEFNDCAEGTACGVIFKMTPAGMLTTIYNFSGTDGQAPNATALVQGTDGNLYGTTQFGGNNNQGTVFKITPSGTLTTLYSFCSLSSCTDGANPFAGLVQGTDGNFYGTTAYGGNSACYYGYGCGTVFKITPSGTLTTLHTFCLVSGCADGENPYARLVQGTDGNFYGMTCCGGGYTGCASGYGCGTVFKMTPSGALTTLHSFCLQAGCPDGSEPFAGLVQGTDGNFYGTTFAGGHGSGNVFKITPSGTLTTLYSFCSLSNCADGWGPYYSGLVQGTDGNFYGTTLYGGSGNGGTCAGGGLYCGTVFKVTPGGTLTTLYSFCSLSNCTDGAYPYAGLVQASNGSFYGMASYGGVNSLGTVFSLTAPSPTAVQFLPVTPCRLVDTRNNHDPIQGGTWQVFVVPQLGGCNIPATAAAYSLNVTVVPHHQPLNYLTIWPAGRPQPYVSTMNSRDGRIKANAAIVPAGASAAVSVYASDTTDVILDIDGYFATSSSDTYQFYPLTPCRIVDTRNDHDGGSLQPGVERDYQIPGNCSVPTSAVAYSFNVTVVPTYGALDYLTVWPMGEPRPTVSTLNNPTGTYVANAAIVPAGGNNTTAFYAHNNKTDLLLDINGYFALPGTGGLSLYTVAPCRVLDTRQSGGSFMGEKMVNVEGSACAPPSNAEAYVFNATVVPPGSMPYLTLWADGQQRPQVSTLNAYDGFITSNMAIVPTNNGSIDAYAAGLTQLILDISGYFAP
jgi:uncharacterized repeat protein (TIGR03803 family)